LRVLAALDHSLRQVSWSNPVTSGIRQTLRSPLSLKVHIIRRFSSPTVLVADLLVEGRGLPDRRDDDFFELSLDEDGSAGSR
jgi:hypothetical protein